LRHDGKYDTTIQADADLGDEGIGPLEVGHILITQDDPFSVVLEEAATFYSDPHSWTFVRDPRKSYNISVDSRDTGFSSPPRRRDNMVIPADATETADDSSGGGDRNLPTAPEGGFPGVDPSGDDTTYWHGNVKSKDGADRLIDTSTGEVDQLKFDTGDRIGELTASGSGQGWEIIERRILDNITGGELTTGLIHDSSDSVGIRVDADDTSPTSKGWTSYIDLGATGSNTFIKTPQLEIQADGDIIMRPEQALGSGLVLIEGASIDFEIDTGQGFVRLTDGASVLTMSMAAPDGRIFCTGDLILNQDYGGGDRIQLYDVNTVLDGGSGTSAGYIEVNVGSNTYKLQLFNVS
jgi:hypothetical protein